MPDYHNEYKVLDEQWEKRHLLWYQRFTMHPVRWILGTVAVLILAGVVSGLASNWWGATRAKLTVGNRVTQQVYGTDNALHNIAYFHSQCNRIVADNNQVRIAADALANDRRLQQVSDPIAQQQAGVVFAQDSAAWTGAKGQLANDVAEYDARSADQTANPFKANGLPHRINVSANGQLAAAINCH